MAYHQRQAIRMYHYVIRILLAFPTVSCRAPEKVRLMLSRCVYELAHTFQDLLHRLKSVPPLFAPNQKSTYSNVAFELLGLVLENATGTSYEKLIRQSVLDPIFMLNTSVTTPQESVMAIPAVKNWWSNDLGVQAPTGAIYSSSSDLSRYLRYILTHYNSLAGINWLQGASWSADESSFYGMPWGKEDASTLSSINTNNLTRDLPHLQNSSSNH